MRRLSNEIIDERLIGRNIKRLGDYKTNKVPIKLLCLADGCGYEWEGRPNDVVGKKKKSGCPKCIGQARITNDHIDEELIKQNRPIKRLGDVFGNKIPLKFQCLVDSCFHIWDGRSDSILNRGQGCPKCGHGCHSNKYIDEQLLKHNRNIKRVSDCINSRDPIDWLCLVSNCGYKWRTSSNLVINVGSSCPKCVGVARVTNESIDLALISNDRNIKRIGDCVRSCNKIEWLCLAEDCGYVWKSPPVSVIAGGSGCHRCAGVAPITNEYVDLQLVKYDRNIKRLGNCLGSMTHIEWLCLAKDCGYIWKSPPCGVITNGNGCPICNAPGVGEKLIVRALISLGIKHTHQFKIRDIDPNAPKYRIDFFIEKIRLAVEYNGKQHYKAVSIYGGEGGFQTQQKRDCYVREFCKKHNIELIEIDGRKYHSYKLTQYLNNTLIPYIKSKL